jgi:hypothetical protein
MDLEKNGELYNTDFERKKPGNPGGHRGDNIDLRPEFCDYHDEGCELADSCLKCPFSKCIFDEPSGKRHLLQLRRDQEIVRLRIGEGKKIKELAEIFGVSKRTVERTLKATNGSTIEKLATPGPSPIFIGVRMTEKKA